MQCSQLGDGRPVGVWHPSNSPCIKALRGEAETGSHQLRSDVLNDAIVGMEFSGHSPLYQRSVYTSRGQSFIGVAATLLHKRGVANDPEFGARLKALIPLAGYKNQRRFAIDGMGWPDTAGPQRLNLYIKGRVPDAETLIQMAAALNVSVTELLGLDQSSSSADASLQGILQHLLALEGIPSDKADTIASALIAARQLFQAFPDEEPLPVRTMYAARAAWIQRRQPAPGT